MKKLQNEYPIKKRGIVWFLWFIPIIVFYITETKTHTETKYWLFGFLPLPKTIRYGKNTNLGND